MSKEGIRSVSLSVVVPACNAEDCLRGTVETLVAYPGVTEVVVVENASRDRTWGLAQELAGEHEAVVAVQSQPGLGSAYAKGLATATGDVTLLTADDLPFGTTDLDSYRVLGRTDLVAIGSKLHPDSQVIREAQRQVFTKGFALFRRVVLGKTVKDSQGTVFVPGEWGRRNADVVGETGWLYSTQLIDLAMVDGLDVVEIPVAGDISGGGTHLRPKDAVDMAMGLVRIRRRRGALRRRAR